MRPARAAGTVIATLVLPVCAPFSTPRAMADSGDEPVATCDALRRFERDDHQAPFYSSQVSSRPFGAPRVEVVCFIEHDAARLLLTDEDAAVFYEIDIDQSEAVP